MKFSNNITWGFSFYADRESDDPTQQFTLLEPTNDEDEAYAAARELVPVDRDVYVKMGPASDMIEQEARRVYDLFAEEEINQGLTLNREPWEELPSNQKPVWYEIAALYGPYN